MRSRLHALLPPGSQASGADEITHARGVGLPLFEKFVISFFDFTQKKPNKKSL